MFWAKRSIALRGVYDLINADFRDRQWLHADLSRLSLDGDNCEGINLFGARFIRTSFCRANLRNAELSFSDATSANFQKAKLEGCMMYRSETTLTAFDGALPSEYTDIPGQKIVRERSALATAWRMAQKTQRCTNDHATSQGFQRSRRKLHIFGNSGRIRHGLVAHYPISILAIEPSRPLLKRLRPKTDTLAQLMVLGITSR
jgi:pentapeptide repeat protein